MLVLAAVARTSKRSPAARCAADSTWLVVTVSALAVPPPPAPPPMIEPRLGPRRHHPASGIIYVAASWPSAQFMPVSTLALVAAVVTMRLHFRGSLPLARSRSRHQPLVVLEADALCRFPCRAGRDRHLEAHVPPAGAPVDDALIGQRARRSQTSPASAAARWWRSGRSPPRHPPPTGSR